MYAIIFIYVHMYIYKGDRTAVNYQYQRILTLTLSYPLDTVQEDY